MAFSVKINDPEPGAGLDRATTLSGYNYLNVGTIRQSSGSPYLDRNWAISLQDQNGQRFAANASIRFYFSQSEFNHLNAASPNITTINDIRFTKYHPTLAGTEDCAINNNTNGTNTEFTPTNSSLQWGDSLLYQSEFIVASFSEFFVNGGSALPIELVDFEANVLNSQVALKWETTKEIEVAYFEIEHSLDAILFTKIGQVAAAGNSNSTQKYAYVHHSPQKGYNYYRLKEIDINGQFTYHATIKVLLENTPLTKIFPNPVEDRLYIQSTSYSNQLVNVRVLDMSQRTVLVQDLGIEMGTNIIELPLNELPQGMYSIEISNDDFQTFHQLFMKK